MEDSSQRDRGESVIVVSTQEWPQARHGQFRHHCPVARNPGGTFFRGGAQEEVNPHDDDDLMRQFVPLLRAQKNLSEEDKQYLEQIVSITLKHVRGKEK